MRKELSIFKDIEGGSDQPLFELIDFNFGVFCQSLESQSLYWYDNMGSIGKFYNLLGLKKTTSKKKDEKLNTILLDLKPDNINSVKNELIEILSFLPCNRYTASLLESKVGHNENGNNYYNIIFPTFDRSKISESDLKDKFKKFFNKKIEEKGNYLPPRLLDFSAINFYDGYENHILATKHSEDLDKNRILFYIDEIKQGNRPVIIVVSGYNDDGKTNSFILDGHHKAAAYLQSKTNPAIIEFNSKIKKSNHDIPNLKVASKILYECQTKHLIRSKFMIEELINKIKKDKLLYKYCLNGEIKEYYPNGQLKVEGNFVDNKKDGIFKWYFPDGSLEKSEKYELEHCKITYEKYSHKGQLLIKGNDDGTFEQYDVNGNRIK